MFETIKNIGAVIGAVAAVIGLWKLYHGRLKLRAKATFEVMRVASSDREQIFNFLEELERRALDERFDQQATTKRVAALLDKWPKNFFQKYGSSIFARPHVWTFEYI